MADTFPRQYARTQRLTLGEPRTFTVSPDGERVVFLRSRGGEDPVNCLCVFDTQSGHELIVADPVALLADGADDREDLPPEERARRERAREGAGGITAYATDQGVLVVAFTLAGRLFVGGLTTVAARELPVEGPVFDPRPDPTARRVAYVSGRALRIAELDGRSWALAVEDDPHVSWGSAEFIAAEEMHRFRGYWWRPDGSMIAACRVDVSPVDQWHIGDPAHPERQPAAVPYPSAGTPNADVSLHLLDLAGGRTEVRWDRQRFPYLVDVRWAGAEHLVLTVQSRDQRTLVVLHADPNDGSTTEWFVDTDPQWVELAPGSPTVGPEGQLVNIADRNGRRRLLVAGAVVTPDDLQVRGIVSSDHAGVVFHANPIDDATVQHVFRYTWDGRIALLTHVPGVHTASAHGGTYVVRTSTLDQRMATFTVHRRGAPEQTLQSFVQQPLVTPRPVLARYGDRRIITAVLLPAEHDGRPLPVLLDPYGGPHAQRVVQSHQAFLTSQWFADQGFAVVVADGRGTPGRGSTWERDVHLDLAGPVLDDQIEALHGAAGDFPLDLGRVAIRGWSFGGYLAALAVLRRPDVFHAAIAGAPVTEWRLYDTHYTERYLGDPNADSLPYNRTSLLRLAPMLERPLLLIHGLADDNVVAAHTLQLSSALLAAGRPHEVLPLAGVTHMTPQEVVAENLLLHQLDFLRRSLPGR